MRWLITGSKGQLGTDLQGLLAGEDVLAVDVDVLDITDSTAVEKAFEDFEPDIVVNAAAYTNVDGAENDEQTAYQVNAVGPAVLASAAKRAGARLIHVSTDYVFPGDASEPYEPGDATGPTSAYGRTKLAGEQAVRELHPDDSYVVRTAWVYGLVGKNFVKTMARLAAEGKNPAVVDDQRGSPTWSRHLAQALVELARSQAPVGIYHATGSGDTTWFGFAQAIFDELGADPARVSPTGSDAYPSPVKRPAYSVLSDRTWREAGLTPMPEWRQALHDAFATGPTAFREG